MNSNNRFIDCRQPEQWIHFIVDNSLIFNFNRGAVLDSHMGNVGGNMAANNGDTQPAMMSFKAFLAAQDDAITDDDAVKKYGEYKLEFRRQQLNEFFVAHKDEEW